MNVPQSLVLGVIQGLTEFLPVSSTAHLILAPEVFNISRHRDEIAHTYDTVIQIGTVLPVLVYFWRDWLNLARAAGRIVLRRPKPGDPDERMVKYLILGSIPAGAAGLLLNDRIEVLSNPRLFPPSLLLIGSALVGVGLLMWWAECTSRKSRTLEHLRLPDAWLVGMAQALALFPGVSRSGSTITAGLFTGLTREAAARFSFLLMMPIMALAAGYKSLKLLGGEQAATREELQGMLLATVVAAITGYLAIHFLLRWLRTRTLGGFALYRIGVGMFAICLYLFQRPPGPAAGPGPAPAPEGAARWSRPLPAPAGGTVEGERVRREPVR